MPAGGSPDVLRPRVGAAHLCPARRGATQGGRPGGEEDAAPVVVAAAA